MHHHPDEPTGPRAHDLDFTTPEGLRHVLADLDTHHAWSTSPIAAELMAYATTKYTPVAKAWHRDPADAAYEAFLAMRTPTTLKATDPWAVVTRAVALGIAAEVHAERNLTSQDKARRPAKRPLTEPVRAGHYEDYFYDVHPHLTPLTGVDVDDDGAEQVVRTAAVFLVVTGWPAHTTEQAVDYIADRITGLASHQSALDVLSGDLTLALRLGYPPRAWTQLVRLVVGVTARRRRPGRLGLLARALLGDTAADLLADQNLVDASRRAAAGVVGGDRAGAP